MRSDFIIGRILFSICDTSIRIMIQVSCMIKDDWFEADLLIVIFNLNVLDMSF